jgi:transposase-like protein
MSNVEDLKNISICDLFYKIALNTARPLPETNEGNKYILIAIDHYFKWCKTKAIPDHTIATATRFLKKYIIYRYGVPNFILIDNGGEWSVEFDNLHKVYSIHHQYTMP